MSNSFTITLKVDEYRLFPEHNFSTSYPLLWQDAEVISVERISGTRKWAIEITSPHLTENIIGSFDKDETENVVQELRPSSDIWPKIVAACKDKNFR